MEEYPKMLYHVSEGQRIVQDHEEEQALGDAWMPLGALRQAREAPTEPTRRTPRRGRRAPEESPEAEPAEE